MVPEAPLERTEEGLVAAGEGWFVLNARDARWRDRPGRGRSLGFEGRTSFPQLGVALYVLAPGEPIGMYHWEANQEDFVILSGEALLLIEGEERPLRQWDFFHCPPGTEHVFVGAGEGPCVILMTGARSEDEKLFYPLSELAARYGASAAKDTADPKEAYAATEKPRKEKPPYWDQLPWA